MHPTTDQHSSEPLSMEELTSSILFGNPILLTTAINVIYRQEDIFLARQVGNNRRTTEVALRRLEGLGLVERIDDGSKPRNVRYQRRGGNFAQIAETLVNALLRKERNEHHTLVPLEPRLESPINESLATNRQWWGWQIDKTGARLLTGGTACLVSLLTLYDFPQTTFWLRAYGELAFYPRCFAEIGLLQPIMAEDGWQQWRRLQSPIWGVVPLLWHFILETYPNPEPTSTYLGLEIFEYQPELSADATVRRRLINRPKRAPVGP